MQVCDCLHSMASCLFAVFAVISTLCGFWAHVTAFEKQVNGNLQSGERKISGSTLHGRSMLRNGLGLTPPMGWNSWNHFGCGINETIIRATADAMVSTGLAALGYEYINIGDCWAELNRDENGYLVPRHSTFPSGIKAIAEYVHGKGLKLGIYSDSGYSTCQKQPGSLGHEQQDASTFASWGVDYLKYDDCHNDNVSMEQERFSAMSDSLMKTGRPIFYAISKGGKGDLAIWASNIANSWRTTGNIKDQWQSVISHADHNSKWADYAGPGGWNDPDILEIGNGGMTKEEYRAQFSIWALMKAPLLIGLDITQMDSDTIEILSNKEIIEINQDPFGIQGKKVNSYRDHEVWSGRLAEDRKVVILWNRSEKVANITAQWEDIGLHPKASVQVRDLWEHTELTASQQANLTVMLESHAVKMYLFLVESPF